MNRPSAILACVSALVLGSCLAQFDRTLFDFTEGPIAFRLEADDIDVPPELVDESTGECRVARLSCSDPACDLEAAACNVDDECVAVREAVLFEVVSTADDYLAEVTRVAWVLLEQVSVRIAASSVNVPISSLRVRWAPVEAPMTAAVDLAAIGRIEPGTGPRELEVQVIESGAQDLQSHLVSFDDFRLFVVIEMGLEPGSTCPRGVMDMEVSLRFLLTTETIM